MEKNYDSVLSEVRDLYNAEVERYLDERYYEPQSDEFSSKIIKHFNVTDVKTRAAIGIAISALLPYLELPIDDELLEHIAEGTIKTIAELLCDDWEYLAYKLTTTEQERRLADKAERVATA